MIKRNGYPAKVWFPLEGHSVQESSAPLAKKIISGFASPGFVGLKVSEELCHFNKSKDYLASKEQFSAGLSNNNLEQRQLIKSELQELLDRASANSNSLYTNTLFDNISSTFGRGSPSYKNSKTAMQTVCKRVRCIRLSALKLDGTKILKEVGYPFRKRNITNLIKHRTNIDHKNSKIQKN